MDKKMIEGNVKKKSSIHGLGLLKIFSPPAFFALLLTGCNTNTVSPDNMEYGRSPARNSGDAIIYYNSFESEKDTAGWYDVTPEMFVNDAAPGRGVKSLLFGGGCIMPTVSISIDIKEAGKYSMSLWEKTADVGGKLYLTIESNDTSVTESYSLDSKDWKYLELDNLYFTADSKIIMDFFAGGRVVATANIDELKIEKIE
jgi:hypothetical protein